MGVTEREGAYLPDAIESAAPSNQFRRIFIPVVLAIGLIAAFLAGYPHLIKQAQSQGFVLQELAPLMNLLIGWGKSLYWMGGRPLFVPTGMALAAALPVAAYYLLKKDSSILSSARVLLVFAVAFLLMYIIGGTRSFPLFIAGVAAVPFLGWLSERGDAEAAAGSTPASRTEAIFLIFILLIGLLMRLYQVDIFPRLYSVDEQLFAQVALDLGKQPLQFFEEPHIMKPHLFRIGAIRLAFSTLGVGLFQQRTVSALEGVITILPVYLLCRKLWGNRAGLFAALLLAVDPWHIGHSRIGVHDIEGPLFLVLLFLLTIRAVKEGGKLNFALLGAAVGATMYLYLSCLIMAPYIFLMALIARYLKSKQSVSALSKEALVMAAAAIVVALPYFTLGRKNLEELHAFYSAGGDFVTAAKTHGWRPAFALFVNFWSGIDFMVDWSSRVAHPAKVLYPNPISIGLFLFGVGILLAMRKRFENLLVLLWIPFAWLPVSLSYGFAERRLFATLAPVTAMLGGLALAKVCGAGAGARFGNQARRLLVIGILIPLIVLSFFIVFDDADPKSGGRAHPRKAAEFIGSLPPEYKVLISGNLKHNPFLVYLASYDRLQKDGNKEAFSFLPIEALAPMAEEIASTPQVALVTDVGAKERQLLEEIKALNPEAQVIESEEYLACVVKN